MVNGKKINMARTFATPAFLREVDKGTFLLFRSIEMEVTDEKTGATTREKVNEMCMSPLPLREFDAKTDEERAVVLQTVNPSTGQVIKLVEVDPR